MNKKIVGSVIAVLAVLVILIVLMVSNTKAPEPVVSGNTETTTSTNTVANTQATTTPVAKDEGVKASTTTSVKVTPKPTLKPVVTAEPKVISQSNSVTISNYSFSPQTLTIKIGTTVTWTNKDLAKHTVTADDGSFESPFFGQGGTYSHTFSEAGTFAYHCSPHPYMKATIVVTN